MSMNDDIDTDADITIELEINIDTDKDCMVHPWVRRMLGYVKLSNRTGCSDKQKIFKGRWATQDATPTPFDSLASWDPEAKKTAFLTPPSQDHTGITWCSGSIAWVNLMWCLKLHKLFGNARRIRKLLRLCLRAEQKCLPAPEKRPRPEQAEMGRRESGRSLGGQFGRFRLPTVLPQFQICVVIQTSQSARDVWWANSIIIYNLDRLSLPGKA